MQVVFGFEIDLKFSGINDKKIASNKNTDEGK